VLLGAPALALAGALIARGGFSNCAQVAFCLLALAALVTVAAVAPADLRAAGRQPIVLTLLGLGALSALSAAWTIGSPDDALRWGAVITGYAALAACGFVAARATGPVPIALLFAAAALICGLIGIFGVAARAGPIAERVDGAWRARGPSSTRPRSGSCSSPLCRSFCGGWCAIEACRPPSAAWSPERRSAWWAPGPCSASR
jgi:hypothetical protein